MGLLRMCDEEGPAERARALPLPFWQGRLQAVGGGARGAGRESTCAALLCECDINSPGCAEQAKR